MRFYFDEKVLSKNPMVYKVDRLSLRLITDFRIQLFKLWKAGDPEAMLRLLKENDLGPDKVGKEFVHDLGTAFKSSGYPTYKPAELEMKTNFIDDNPLITSGKFRYRDEGRHVGLVINPDFEKEMFEMYPEVSVEDSLIRGELDLLDVGYQRIRNLKIAFEEKAKKLYSNERSEEDASNSASKDSPGRENNRKVECSSEKNPYILKITGSMITLTDLFYNETCLLTSVSLDEILNAYELSGCWFSDRNRMIIRSKQARWVLTDTVDTSWHEQMFRIQKNRSCLMAKAVADGFQRIGKKLPEMNTEGRRTLCRHISELPEDPWGFYTTKKILQKIGMSKSVYYELLNNENYGTGRERRAHRDEEDIVTVRKVLDYKGFAKGSRQVYMLMPHVTGKQFSLYRIRRLMRKYGIRTTIRRPSKNRKAMKELIERNRKANLLLRRFRLHRPNEVRLTDVTYLDYGDGLRAYGSASIDPATGRLICFVISENNDLQLALDTLKAMDQYPAKNGAIFHSDQGILYMTDELQTAVVERALTQSMSRRGNCWDNAPQEAFFGHFKDESGYEKCRTIEELKDKVNEYAVYYNEERKIWERGKLTPIEYEDWLNAMTDEEFQDYLAKEEEKYRKQKEESAEKAIRRAREYRDNTLAALEEKTDETGR